MPDSRSCLGNKATNVPKMRGCAPSEPAHYVKLRANRRANRNWPCSRTLMRRLRRLPGRRPGARSCSVRMASAAFAARPARAQTRAHAIAMHGEPAWGPGFQPADLCQSGGAQRRPIGARRARHFRQPQSFHRARPSGGKPAQLHRRKPAGARLRRAVHALRPDRARRRDRRRARPRHLHHQPGGALCRRQAGDAG